MINDHDDDVLVVENSEWNLSDLEEDALTVGALLHKPGVRGERLPVHHGDGEDGGEGDDGEGGCDSCYGGNVNVDDDLPAS